MRRNKLLLSSLLASTMLCQALLPNVIDRAHRNLKRRPTRFGLVRLVNEPPRLMLCLPLSQFSVFSMVNAGTCRLLGFCTVKAFDTIGSVMA